MTRRQRDHEVLGSNPNPRPSKQIKRAWHGRGSLKTFAREIGTPDAQAWLGNK